MDKKVRKWLFDILLAIEGIESLIERSQGDYEIFANDLGLCWGFERGFEIIGEAMNRIEKQSPGINISNLRGFIDMRKLYPTATTLFHTGYFGRLQPMNCLF